MHLQERFDKARRHAQGFSFVWEMDVWRLNRASRLRASPGPPLRLPSASWLVILP